MSIRISSFFVCVLCGILGTVRTRYPDTIHSTSEENTALLKHAASISSPAPPPSPAPCLVSLLKDYRAMQRGGQKEERGGRRQAL